jgi:serine/threonine protein kinase
MPLALHVLDGVLAGLEAMHGVGIAHLDVKPSNVILRAATSDPVLVDLGLAGRKVRPGCATLCFGAPEIWTTSHADAHRLPAAAADVYAFGCSAYEILTGKTLFDGPSDVSIITQHLSHDGLPQGLAPLANRPRLLEFLGACLRQAPTSRVTVSQLRAALSEVRRELEGARWPLT